MRFVPGEDGSSLGESEGGGGCSRTCATVSSRVTSSCTSFFEGASSETGLDDTGGSSWLSPGGGGGMARGGASVSQITTPSSSGVLTRGKGGEVGGISSSVSDRRYGVSPPAPFCSTEAVKAAARGDTVLFNDFFFFLSEEESSSMLPVIVLVSSGESGGWRSPTLDDSTSTPSFHVWRRTRVTFMFGDMFPWVSERTRTFFTSLPLEKENDRSPMLPLMSS